MSDTQKWYIVKNNDGCCEIGNLDPLEAKAGLAAKTVWGPFRDRQDAIARRVGLIRAGKCQPKQG